MSRKILLRENLDTALERITAWWNNESIGRPCLSFSLRKPGEPELSKEELNKYWPSPQDEPDLKSLVEEKRKDIERWYHFAESIPRFGISWGGRSTDTVLPAFLGGRVTFTDRNAWTKSVITDWEKFKPSFDKNNIWFKRGLEFFRLIVEKSDGNYIPVRPLLGDWMTNLAVLKGFEDFLIDLIKNKKTIINLRDRMIRIRHRYYEEFWNIYSKKFPGDRCAMIWAPGKVCLSECDISTMFSTEMFIEFVVPEIEATGKNFDFMIWHLDGAEEIKHLDVILELPQIKAIQWVPNPRGRETPSRWLPMYKKIQDKGKSLLLYPADEEEVKMLLKTLSPKGLFLQGGFSGKNVQEAYDYIDMVERLCQIRKNKL